MDSSSQTEIIRMPATRDNPSTPLTTPSRKRTITDWFQSPARENKENDEKEEVVFEASRPKPSSSKRRKEVVADETVHVLKPIENAHSPSKKASVKKSTQQSITGFCTSQPIVATPVVIVTLEDEIKNAKEYYKAALDALKKSQPSKYKQAIREARKLSDAAIDTVESECFKFALRRLKKENNPDDDDYHHFDEMLSRLSKDIYEDTSLKSTAFPDLKSALTDSTNAELLGGCLFISEFFDSFSVFMDTKLKFSAEDLLTALNKGVSGYYKLTSHVLSAFIHAFSFHGFLKNIKFFSSYLDNVPWSSSASSEICKLFLLREVTPLTEVLTNATDGHLHTCFKQNEAEIAEKAVKLDLFLKKKLAKAFADIEFYELKPFQQIRLFKHLINILMSMDDFNKQFDFKEELMDKLTYNRKKSKLVELLKIKADNKARGRSITVENDKIRQLEKEIADEDYRRRLANFHASMKPQPLTLGYDRFHRRYYIFQNPHNHGIFIEEFCQIALNQTSDESENGDPFAVELEKLTIESAQIPMRKSVWYHISNMEEFEAVREILSKKGIRESALCESFENHSSQIKATLNGRYKALQLNFDDDRTELDYLKEDAVQLIKKAEAKCFIHFSKKVKEILMGIDKAQTFDELRNEIVSTTVPAILPCAFNPKFPGQKFFRIKSWLRFAELCQSVSQMHALLSILKSEIRTDKLFGIKCTRCRIRFDVLPFKKIIACVLCYGFIHFKCHDLETEADPDPMKPFWVCEVCKKLPKKVPEENIKVYEKKIEPKEVKVIQHNGRTLRATKAREARESADDSSSRATSRTMSRASSRATSYTSSRYSPEQPRRSLRNRKPVQYKEEEGSPLVYQKKEKKRHSLLGHKRIINAGVLDRYEQFAGEYRITRALQAVKFSACGYHEMTLEILKKYLHQFKNSDHLDTAFRSLMDAAKLHFMNNARKSDEIQKHFDIFFEKDKEEIDGECEVDDDDDEQHEGDVDLETHEATEEGVHLGESEDEESVHFDKSEEETESSESVHHDESVHFDKSEEETESSESVHLDESEDDEDVKSIHSDDE